MVCERSTSERTGWNSTKTETGDYNEKEIDIGTAGIGYADRNGAGDGNSG